MDRIDLRFLFFDWDDNILHLDTKMNLDYLNDDNIWVPKTLNTSEYAIIRNDSRYRKTTSTFTNFTDTGRLLGDVFLLDCIDSVNRKRFGPSYNAFKECLLNANLFFIITARGHEPANIRRAIEYFIFTQFSRIELETMINNIRYYFIEVYKKKVKNDSLLDLYLNKCGYTGTSSDSFISSINEKNVIDNVELCKELAILKFVKKSIKITKKLESRLGHISIGFSDDDPKNLKHISDVFREKLKKEFNDVKFVVYDTSKNSDGTINYNKMVI